MPGFSGKHFVAGAPLLLLAASCVPGAGIGVAAPPKAVAATQQAPEWARLDSGMPYKLFEKAVAPAEPFSAEAASDDDRARSLECLTKAIYYEARSESEDGQRAVAQVVLNRVRHPAYPNSVCGVVYQGSQRATGCQFTFTCDGSLRYAPVALHWARARRIAAEALAGEVYAPVGNATHYHTTAIYPYWAPSLTRAAVVGAHVFYRWKGNQGQPGAFSQRYAGFEPGAAPALAAYQPAIATFAEAAEVESGVRKWRGASADVRVHRGTSSSSEEQQQEQETERQEDFGVQVHRGSFPTSTS